MIKEIAVKENTIDSDDQCVALEKVFRDYFKIESNLLDLERKFKSILSDDKGEK